MTDGFLVDLQIVNFHSDPNINRDEIIFAGTLNGLLEMRFICTL